MKNYKKPDTTIWTGRQSDTQLYFHEKVKCIDLTSEQLPETKTKTIAILGYDCDEGVRRNQGRIGAAEGPKAIRKMLSPLSNHFDDTLEILDIGTIDCISDDLESTQRNTSDRIKHLIENKILSIVLGGGHDLAYAHYNGIKNALPHQTIGIINLDAHFDLRPVVDKPNSGTPFHQIAQENNSFKYLCLGVQKASNNRELFKTANALEIQFVKNTAYTLENFSLIESILVNFINSVDHIYLTIDMDGFSSAYAPGVSAPSPLGFSVDIAQETIRIICKSNKLISADIVELNPIYDIDNCTARLAARLVYQIIDEA